ncbi:hypothetical protein Alo02nite_71980 [Actinoplanes lobatus]|nr:hypothetical protein Alo02nite_71980 [Actinoplanes lobatus]
MRAKSGEARTDPVREDQMAHNTQHHVPRIDDTATGSTLHEQAEAVAVPDFDHLEQMITGVAAGLTDRPAHERTYGPAARPAP